MCRFLLSLASIFFLLTAALLPPPVIARSRCPVALPSTLLSLYRNSEFIYIGTYDKLEEGDLINDAEEYREVSISKHFTISSALKGETRKIVTLKDSEYHFKVANLEQQVVEDSDTPSDTTVAENEDGELKVVGPEPPPTEVVEETEPEEEEDSYEIKPGDSVLMFMNRDEDTDELILSDRNDGLKKITPEKLAAYAIRIRELNEIFGSEQPTYAQVVAWIVRCAEDPHTRWEGTYELLRSFQTLDYEEERSKTDENDKAAEDSDGSAIHSVEEAEEDTEDVETSRVKKFETGDPNFARNLSEGEKQILTDLFLKREPSASTKDVDGTTELRRGDRELIDLVSRWGDARVAIALLADLRAASADTDMSADIMPMIASMLIDEDLLNISARYTSIRWEEDTGEVESDETGTATDEGTDNSQAPVDRESPAVSEVGSAPPENVHDQQKIDSSKVRKKTYGELRKELLARFLARADKVVSAAEEAKGQN
jgi:hypothetical protein